MIVLVACGGSDGSLFDGDGGGDPADASTGGGSSDDASATGGSSGDGGNVGSGGSGGATDPDGGPSTGGDGSTPDAPDAPVVCSDGEALFADLDGDGFGDPGAPVAGCTASGVSPNSDDCYDGNADAKPGQEAFFPEDRGDGSFDYNCDGDETQESDAIGACTIAICGALNEGWESSVPPCGDQHPWITTCTGLAFCTPTTEPRVQGCR